jgi:hypothetical protein
MAGRLLDMEMPLLSPSLWMSGNEITANRGKYYDIGYAKRNVLA